MRWLLKENYYKPICFEIYDLLEFIVSVADNETKELFVDDCDQILNLKGLSYKFSTIVFNIAHIPDIPDYTYSSLSYET